jgi:hypothetical protein
LIRGNNRRQPSTTHCVDTVDSHKSEDAHTHWKQKQEFLSKHPFISFLPNHSPHSFDLPTNQPTGPTPKVKAKNKKTPKAKCNPSIQSIVPISKEGYQKPNPLSSRRRRRRRRG